MSRSDAAPDEARKRTKPTKRYNVVEEIGIRIHFTFPDLLAIDDDRTADDGGGYIGGEER